MRRAERLTQLDQLTDQRGEDILEACHRLFIGARGIRTEGLDHQIDRAMLQMQAARGAVLAHQPVGAGRVHGCSSAVGRVIGQGLSARCASLLSRPACSTSSSCTT